MRVAIRCDVSPVLGAGHWMRCLALARALTRDGAEVSFLCRAEAGDFKPVMQAAGLPIHWLPAEPSAVADPPPPLNPLDDADACASPLAAQPVDWLILDRHGLGAAWQARLRGLARWRLVIDDLAETEQECDLLLNPNLPIDAGAYRFLVPAHCRLLLGPEYALLGEDFLRCQPRLRDGHVRRLLISFGGSDPPGASLLTLAALKRLQATSALDGLERILLVAGPGNLHWPALRTAAQGLPRLRLVRQVRAMAAQLQAADLVIGAAGGSLWERGWLGVPALVLALVPHQRPVAEDLAARDAIEYLGPVEQLDAKQLAARIAAALQAPGRLREIARNARKLIGQAAFIRAPRALLEAA
ncbi:UDP-2,4-diacetamido-2,4,6-trideoxy-beta-L-altropyranose hydrolase [Thiorhodovibrio frisius]|uniref:Pseudaminic acid biosynthesis-associated protein PseG n=1 Tax=Thiorhodovibrio frisius TaxID=631362 RepID=H8Z4C9_9GAMM|nr:UDP-2,4-diacetamido-2,4,6-trideoxy-beta-L-altropyranose hydrolase [Thiorhodovibrio frisius]EIC20186.1 pseudaminic acid biosynthesis-associated protein PseG [Thiorhodovibrio frisius]WPL20923.1 UDP-2,4-diacetamido-2,4,6-trideoxy-beta-L-altropyranose hydrolase [Thiorhodovibrio frisius]